jgi:hypothetical protein
MNKYYFIAILILIVGIGIYLFYVAFFKSKSNITTQLTGVLPTTTQYVLSQEDVSKINSKIPMSNYAVSIWHYIYSWSETSTPKNIIRIPNVLEIYLGTASNDLYIKLYGPDVATPPTPTPPTPTPPTPTPPTPTPPTPTPPTPTPPTVPQTVNFTGLLPNTVYKYGKAFIFVYELDPESTIPLREVRVAFTTRRSIQAITASDIARQTNNDSPDGIYSLQLYSYTGDGGIPNDIRGTPVSNDICPALRWVCDPTDRRWWGGCPQTMPAEGCAPVTSELQIKPYPTLARTKQTTLVAAVYNLTNASNQAYFADGTKFSFMYSGVVTKVTPITTLLPYPNTGISGFESGSLNMSGDPMVLPSPSSLIPINLLQNNIIETFQTEVTARNMPLQTWSHILVNVVGKNVTVYVNGQIQSAYVLPLVPYQMNAQIEVNPLPSFVGWTSGLQYIPYGVSAGDVRNIYNSGYLGKASASNWLSFFNRYSMKVVFIDNASKLLK